MAMPMLGSMETRPLTGVDPEAGEDDSPRVILWQHSGGVWPGRRTIAGVLTLVGVSALALATAGRGERDHPLITRLEWATVLATEDCTTVGADGDAEGPPCVFPFVYNGVEYKGCTKQDHNSLWCATEVDDEKNMAEDMWAHCPENAACLAQACTTGGIESDDQEDPCVFPFIYKGVEYKGCTKEDHHSLWCPTEVDDENNFNDGKWRHCPESDACLVKEEDKEEDVKKAAMKKDDLNPCSALPYLRLEKMIRNNLGGHGPDDGEEGLVMEVSAYHSGVRSKNAELHIHAITDYHPSWPKENGIHGKFGQINLEHGTNVTLSVYATDPEAGKNITLSQGSFTFFDLDQGHNNHSVEYVNVGGFAHYYVGQNSQVVVVPQNDGTTTFRSSKEGNGDDNPLNPLELAAAAKEKGVTLSFENLNSLTVTLGATPGNTTRVFSFVVRPSMLCAYTVLDDGTLVNATADVPGNVIPMADGKKVVSWADVKEQEEMSDGFDCAAGYANAAEGWSDEKKAWCCDQEDVACELLGNETGNTTAEPEDAGADTTTPRSGAARTSGHAILALVAYWATARWATL